MQNSSHRSCTGVGSEEEKVAFRSQLAATTAIFTSTAFDCEPADVEGFFENYQHTTAQGLLA
ncbi:predicted protein [Sclerotinia sclerotiorum 1980 UF-70]|uniref:Uncharacterized protein n=1 Tax=Sclerotinia sclerotiorum (strain ATCC 18683 / 1980 / Ss-1) TaxID=665079 RepID=A7EJT9_SCLS1|nr:predicted protein [Sclerotinia sclerotiorum 1980 UF-70]EDO03105.1 predicted protein [Sclerotinia sclerotiorum 1980 UF-70]